MESTSTSDADIEEHIVDTMIQPHDGHNPERKLENNFDLIATSDTMDESKQLIHGNVETDACSMANTEMGCFDTEEKKDDDVKSERNADCLENGREKSMESTSTSDADIEEHIVDTMIQPHDGHNPERKLENNFDLIATSDTMDESKQLIHGNVETDACSMANTEMGCFDTEEKKDDDVKSERISVQGGNQIEPVEKARFNFVIERTNADRVENERKKLREMNPVISISTSDADIEEDIVDTMLQPHDRHNPERKVEHNSDSIALKPPDASSNTSDTLDESKQLNHGNGKADSCATAYIDIGSFDDDNKKDDNAKDEHISVQGGNQKEPVDRVYYNSAIERTNLETIQSMSTVGSFINPRERIHLDYDFITFKRLVED